MAETEYHFIISMASLLPHTLNAPPYFCGSPGNIASRMLTAGYKGFQNLLIRGHDPTDPACWWLQSEYSWYKEGAWNAIDTWQQGVHHEIGAAGEPAKLQDWVIFPDTATVNRLFPLLPGRHVSHDFDGSSDLVETKPGHGLNGRQMAEVAEAMNCNICLDTEHAIENCHDGSPSPYGRTINDRIQAIDDYAHLVSLVHLKGDPENIGSPEQRAAEQLAKSSRRRSQIDVCVEFRPDPMESADEAIARARRCLRWAKWIFKAA